MLFNKISGRFEREDAIFVVLSNTYIKIFFFFFDREEIDLIDNGLAIEVVDQIKVLTILRKKHI